MISALEYFGTQPPNPSLFPEPLTRDFLKSPHDSIVDRVVIGNNPSIDEDLSRFAICSPKWSHRVLASFGELE